MIHDDEGLIDVNEVMDVFLYIVISFQHWAVGILYTLSVDVSMMVWEGTGMLHDYQESIHGVGQPKLVNHLENLKPNT
jgi:hypothetical protein